MYLFIATSPPTYEEMIARLRQMSPFAKVCQILFSTFDFDFPYCLEIVETGNTSNDKTSSGMECVECDCQITRLARPRAICNATFGLFGLHFALILISSSSSFVVVYMFIYRTIFGGNQIFQCNKSFNKSFVFLNIKSF